MNPKTILSALALSTCIAAYAQQIDPAIKQKLDKIIEPYNIPGQPGGTVLIAKQGNVLYNRGFGLASVELNVPMKPDMLFEIGTQTKQFTAICMLQLIEKDKLSINDVVTEYIEDCPASWQQVTIKNLLTQSSGITDLRNGGILPFTQKLAAYQNQPLAFTPGSKTSDGDIEFQLLGVIIEKVSAQPLGKYIKDNILIPLGMKHTYWIESNTVIPNRTPGYYRKSTGLTALGTGYPPPNGCIGLMSNTSDMLIWYEAIVAGKLVNEQTLRQAWKPYTTTDGQPSIYNYGWTTGTVQGSPMVERSGTVSGHSTESLYTLDEGVFVAVFLNQHGRPEAMAHELAAIIIGKPYAANNSDFTKAGLKEYTGTFELNDGSK